MQMKKSYSTTIDVGTSTTRTYVYDKPNTMSIDNRSDWFNQTLADFLQECGVDAAYEARGSNPDKYLWIFGVPFLYVYAYNNGYKKYGYNSYAPGSTDTFSSGVFYIFNGNTSEVSFSLLFDGNPKTAFALRWIEYGATSLAVTCHSYYRAKNMVTGRPALIVRGFLITSGGGDDYIPGYFIIEMKDEGLPDSEHFIRGESLCANPLLNISEDMRNNMPDKILLYPFTVSIWECIGVYKLPSWYLPNPAIGSIEHQSEIEIGGRRFLHTTCVKKALYNSSYYSRIEGNYLNLGLIEITE